MTHSDTLYTHPEEKSEFEFNACEYIWENSKKESFFIQL